MDIVAFWLNVVGFSLLFGTFFLTYISRKTNRHVMFDQYLWYIGLSFIWFLFQFIGFIYQTVIPRDIRALLLINSLVRFIFTILIFHRLPLFLDSIITGEISSSAKRVSLVFGLGMSGLLIVLGVVRPAPIGPYVTVLVNGLVGASFLYTFIKVCYQHSFRTKRMRSFLLISAVGFLFFSWYALMFIILPHLHRPAFDALVSALFIIVWCLNDAMVYLHEFSSVGIRERSMIENFYDQYKLSKREREIVSLLIDGLSYKEIAFGLSLSPRTVETHIYRIFKKCSVSTKLELINKIFPLRNPT